MIKAYLLYTNKFEFDSIKNALNLKKHGIDFDRSRLLWDDPNAVRIQAKTTEEDRYLIIAECDSKIWTGVFTYRNESVRIISVRRARENEKEIYYS